jgi:hypothetical protein
MPSEEFDVLNPSAQVDFFYQLEAIRDLYLAVALSGTVRQVSIEALDRELTEIVPASALSKLASAGLRGERFFAVPLLLTSQPTLIGYYRLLYGFSQKAFYSQGPFGRFKSMEERNELSRRAANQLRPLCDSLARTGALLLDRLPRTSQQLFHELQLLSLGPQFRGGRNNVIGADASAIVLQMVAEIAEGYIVERSPRQVVVRNPAGRSIVAVFSADPDIAIEDVSGPSPQPLVSVEIKGGRDVSNVHNRLGEAEKSHQNARVRGFYQFWTIVGVPISESTARAESPTTTKFYDLSSLGDRSSAGWVAFRDDLARIFGLPTPT